MHYYGAGGLVICIEHMHTRRVHWPIVFAYNFQLINKLYSIKYFVTLAMLY